jgi:heme-degrading monooxygenase HmoA
LTADEEQEMFRRVGEWPQRIEGFTGLRLGKDVGDRSRGFSYLLLTEFENEEAHQAYYSKPAHVEFSEFVMALGAEVIRVDYPLTSETLFV